MRCEVPLRLASRLYRESFLCVESSEALLRCPAPHCPSKLPPLVDRPLFRPKPFTSYVFVITTLRFRSFRFSKKTRRVAMVATFGLTWLMLYVTADRCFQGMGPGINMVGDPRGQHFPQCQRIQSAFLGDRLGTSGFPPMSRADLTCFDRCVKRRP